MLGEEGEGPVADIGRRHGEGVFEGHVAQPVGGEYLTSGFRRFDGVAHGDDPPGVPLIRLFRRFDDLAHRGMAEEAQLVGGHRQATSGGELLGGGVEDRVEVVEAEEKLDEFGTGAHHASPRRASRTSRMALPDASS